MTSYSYRYCYASIFEPKRFFESADEARVHDHGFAAAALGELKAETVALALQDGDPELDRLLRFVSEEIPYRPRVPLGEPESAA